MSLNKSKSKKAAINPVNKKYNKYFQYTITVITVYYEKLKKDPQRITKIKAFINKCN